MNNALEQQISMFKAEVIRLATLPTYIHHKWYVTYHLNLVETLSADLCNIYVEADRDLVIVLVWLHDYGKIIGSTREATLVEGRAKLFECGFPNGFVEKAVSFASLIDAKERLDTCPIEVQIVSSADGASHLLGPFAFLWWYENPEKSIEVLLEDSRTKFIGDWEKKIVLPIVRDAFATRKQYMMELLGNFRANLMTEIL